VKNKAYKAFKSKKKDQVITSSNCRTASLGWSGCTQFDFFWK